MDWNLLTFPLCVPQSIEVCGRRKYHCFYWEETLAWLPAEAVMTKPSMLVNIHISSYHHLARCHLFVDHVSLERQECKHWLRLCVRRRELFAHETFLIRGSWFSDAAWKNCAISRQRHFVALFTVKHHQYVLKLFHYHWIQNTHEVAEVVCSAVGNCLTSRNTSVIAY